MSNENNREWRTSFRVNSPRDIYRPGKMHNESESSGFDPLSHERDCDPWPKWHEYRNRDLRDFPGATARLAVEQVSVDEEQGDEPISADD